MGKARRHWNWRKVAAFAALGRFALEAARVAWDWLNDEGSGPYL